jgi:hypothetical protein
VNTEVIPAEAENVIDIQLQVERLTTAKKQAAWNAHRTLLDPIVRALTDLKIMPRFDDWDFVTIHTTGDAKHLTSIMRVLRTSGFATSNDRPKPGSSEWSAVFHKEGCPLDFYLFFTSNVCKRIKVGTKMVEQDVYEIQCDEPLTIEPPEQPVLEVQA